MGNDIVSDHLVRSQWERIRLLERLDEDYARQLLHDELAAERERAERTMQPLHPWEAIPERNRRVYEGGANQVRLRRVLDFVQPGDRVLDIGTGYGYLTGILLRDTKLAAYCGIDLEEHLLESVRQMVAVNGLDNTAVHLERRSLYDLDRAFVSAHRPRLVTLLEVLEHVPDAERALATIGATLDQDASLLFTVPLLGRLEACWGHVSLFDEARLTAMCAAAGLDIAYVEPLHNTWMLVLAARSVQDVGDRLADALAATPMVTPPRRGSYAFVAAVPHEGASRWTRGAQAELTRVGQGVRCHARGGPHTGRHQYAGVRLAVDGLDVLRLEFAVETPEHVRALYADVEDAEGQRLARWTWQAAAQGPPPGEATTVVLKPGKGHRGFRPSGPVQSGRAVAVELFMELTPERTAGLTLTRAAYVPA